VDFGLMGVGRGRQPQVRSAKCKMQQAHDAPFCAAAQLF
jgi:hypothetical protein